MKKKSIAMIALAMLLALSLMSATTAFAAPVSTTAMVAFTQGVVEFGDAELEDGLNNMNIDFGSHTLPVGPVDYCAEDGSGGNTGSHTLRVLNSRTDADEWSINVSMSKFSSKTEGVTNSFTGTITMTGPIASDGLSAEPTVTIVSTASAVDVVFATEDITNGTYDTTWSREKIKLFVNEPDVSTITKPASYSATLTWTLANTPS